MPQRVVEQVRDHLDEQLPVARHRQRLIEARDESFSLFLGGGLKRLDDLARDLGEIERPEGRPPCAGLDLADAQESVEGLEHAFDFGDRSVDRGPHRFRRASPSRAASRRRSMLAKRLAQVVGDVGADLLVGDEQLLDAVEQAVEGARERGQIVVDRARAESGGSSRRP